MRLQFQEKGMWSVLYDNAPTKFAITWMLFLANHGMVAPASYFIHLIWHQLTFYIL
jgi:hypothetical protein